MAISCWSRLFLISHKVQHTSLRGAKRRGNPDVSIQNDFLIDWIASRHALLAVAMTAYYLAAELGG
jgi:hypothetical protein